MLLALTGEYFRGFKAISKCRADTSYANKGRRKLLMGGRHLFKCYLTVKLRMYKSQCANAARDIVQCLICTPLIRIFHGS